MVAPNSPRRLSGGMCSGNPKDHNVALPVGSAIAAPEGCEDSGLLRRFQVLPLEACCFSTSRTNGDTKSPSSPRRGNHRKNARVSFDITRERVVRVMTGENGADGKSHKFTGTPFRMESGDGGEYPRQAARCRERLSPSGTGGGSRGHPLLVRETESRLFAEQ